MILCQNLEENLFSIPKNIYFLFSQKQAGSFGGKRATSLRVGRLNCAFLLAAFRLSNLHTARGEEEHHDIFHAMRAAVETN
jgi:hypothetical protein